MESEHDEVLDRQTCLGLLSRTSLGRIGVSAAALPHVEPVHFRLLGDEIVFRVGRRTRLDIAATDNVVAFEVDSFDAAGRSGWCIVITGVARRTSDPEAMAALETLDAPPWGATEDDAVIAIPTDVMSGRRIGPRRDPTVRLDRLATAEVLGVEECWRLLAAEEVGRLAVIRGADPVVLPVNYVVDGTCIVFRTDPGTKYHQGPRSKVSFEIDGLDHAAQSGWSVVASGFLEEIPEHDVRSFERAGRLAVEPWAGGKKPHVMRMVASSVTGRRVGLVSQGAEQASRA